MRKIVGIMALAGLVGALPGVGAANEIEEGAKSLFYADQDTTVRPRQSKGEAPRVTKPPKPATQVAKRPGQESQPVQLKAPREQHVGIKYSIQLIEQDGKRTEVPPERVFRSGERLKLLVESNTDGYLYLLNVGSTGRHHLLFPHPRLAAGSNFVAAGTVYELPHGAVIRFDSNPGEELLVAMFALTELQPPPDADPASRAVTPTEARRIVTAADTRGAKDLVLESDTAGAEPAVYAVARRSSVEQTGMLAVRIRLRHE